MFGKHAGEFSGGLIGARQRLVGEAMGFVHVLTETNHPQDARNDVFHTVLAHTRDFQTNRIRAAINTGNGYRHSFTPTFYSSFSTAQRHTAGSNSCLMADRAISPMGLRPHPSPASGPTTRAGI